MLQTNSNMTFKHECLLLQEAQDILQIAKNIIAGKPFVWDNIYIKTWFNAFTTTNDEQIYFINQVLPTRFLLTVVNYYELQLGKKNN